jgi:hypothetical protein
MSNLAPLPTCHEKSRITTKCKSINDRTWKTMVAGARQVAHKKAQEVASFNKFEIPITNGVTLLVFMEKTFGAICSIHAL